MGNKGLKKEISDLKGQVETLEEAKRDREDKHQELLDKLEAKLEQEKEWKARKEEEEKEHKELMSKLDDELQDLQQKREDMKRDRERDRELWKDELKARAEEEKKNMNVTVQDYSKKEEKQFNNYLTCVGKIPDVTKTINPSVAFLGKTSCGKSTMINKIYGTKCKTSPLRCTQGVEMVVSSDDLEVFDVYGVNDEETYASLKVLKKTKELHVVVCIYTDAVDHVLKLARLLDALNLNIIFVRNKCEDFNAEECREVKQHDESKLKSLIKKVNFFGVIIASGKTGLGMKGISATIATATNPVV